MIIKTLVENTSISEEFGHEHGLSLYLETKGRKILFDVGASSLFLENAEKLDVEIENVEYLVISHGHYDHGGGLGAFLEKNSKAKVYVHPCSFEKHYALGEGDELIDIGLEKSLKREEQIILTGDRFRIDEGIQLFSNVVPSEPLPATNRGLLTEQNGQKVEDTFAHEQNLVIEEDGRFFLVTGCAHNGIVNIVNHFQRMTGRMPDYVIGGFHLSRGSADERESDEAIERIGRFFSDTKAGYFTGHCTGLEPYRRLKNSLGENIDYLSAGSVITL